MTPRTAAQTRRFWVDPRFVIGVLLIVASVFGVWLVVTASARGATVYVAAHTLVPGDTVTGSDLVASRVRIGDAAGRYLTTVELNGESAVVSRTVQTGELVPKSAIASAASAQQDRVMLTVTGPLPSVVTSGAVVDVWSSASTGQGRHAAPVVIAHSVTVAAITDHDGMVSSDQVSVEVLVASDDVAAVLQAGADGDLVSLVSAAGGAR